MSQVRMTKRLFERSSRGNNLVDLSDLKDILNPLLLPITSSINALNETVSALVSAWNTREENLHEAHKTEFNPSNITMDVMASDIHRLSKSYTLLKDQYCTYKQALHGIHEKMCSVEKLIVTMVKKQAKKAISNPSVLDIFHQFENFLMSSKKIHSNGSLTSETDLNEPSSTLDIGPMQVVTLNREDDFPLGSWLGNPSVSKLRVRCSIRPDDLVYVNTKCSTPEKMALTLLDFLFSKEILSVSNLSGKSKLGKKKLDPLLIYGIKCHLIHVFSITEKQWEKIKLKIDSKCRTAWKKRRLAPELCTSYNDELYQEDSQSQDSFKNYSENVNVCDEVDRPKARVIRTVQGDIEILKADQVLHLQDLHNIHVLDGDHILPIISSDGEDVENGIALSCSSQQSQLAIVEGDMDTVSFVMEPMMEVLTERVSLKIEQLSEEEQ